MQQPKEKPASKEREEKKEWSWSCDVDCILHHFLVSSQDWMKSSYVSLLTSRAREMALTTVMRRENSSAIHSAAAVHYGSFRFHGAFPSQHRSSPRVKQRNVLQLPNLHHHPHQSYIHTCISTSPTTSREGSMALRALTPIWRQWRRASSRGWRRSGGTESEMSSIRFPSSSLYLNCLH